MSPSSRHYAASRRQRVIRAVPGFELAISQAIFHHSKAGRPPPRRGGVLQEGLLRLHHFRSFLLLALWLCGCAPLCAMAHLQQPATAARYYGSLARKLKSRNSPNSATACLSVGLLLAWLLLACLWTCLLLGQCKRLGRWTTTSIIHIPSPSPPPPPAPPPGPP
jgi:hypothetical protein